MVQTAAEPVFLERDPKSIIIAMVNMKARKFQADKRYKGCRYIGQYTLEMAIQVLKEYCNVKADAEPKKLQSICVDAVKGQNDLDAKLGAHLLPGERWTPPKSMAADLEEILVMAAHVVTPEAGRLYKTNVEEWRQETQKLIAELEALV